MPLVASIEVPAGQTENSAFEVLFRVRNDGGGPAAILNPDVGVPDPAMQWPLSDAVYRVSTLLWFHCLAISVRETSGLELARREIPAWSTPALLPDMLLAPGQSLTLEIPLGPFYALEAGKQYRVWIRYGAGEVKIEAETLVTTPDAGK